MRTRSLVRASATIAVIGGITAASLLAPSGAMAETSLPVYPSDLSSVNYSAGSTSFDAYGARYTSLPTAGSKWVLDIENKSQSSHGQTPTGLRLDGVDPGSAGWPSKVRYQYYLGSGGYPTVDGVTDDTVGALVSSLSWYVKYPVAGAGVAGVDFAAQKLVDGDYHRVSGFVQCEPTPPARSGTDFFVETQSACRWAVNSRMVETAPGDFSYTPGQYLYSGVSPQGSTTDFLSEFSDYEIVSFGPNVGRYAPLDATVVIQTLKAFGTTFSFVEEEKSAPAPPAADSGSLDALLTSAGVTPQTLPGEVDPQTPLALTSAWAAVDGWVDVYAYSSPVYLGTFPVAFGKVDLTGLDLSSLTPGAHTLLLIGQSSGALSAYRITIPLSATGVDATIPVLIAGSLLIAGAILRIAVSARRKHRRNHRAS